MAPFSWLPYLFAVFYATTSAATPARDIVKPRAINLPHDGLHDNMYADRESPIMKSS